MTLTPPEHEHSAAITMAAEWLCEHPRNREANLRGQRAA